MRGSQERIAIGAGFAAILVLGATFRFWNIFSESLWLDEAYSAFAASKGYAFLWNVVPLYETHPPLYYSLLRTWTLVFGDSLAALRSLGLLAGMATIPVAALAAREIAHMLRLSERARLGYILLSTLLVACSPVLVWMSREVRPYPLMILTYAGLIALLFRMGNNRAAGKSFGGPAYIGYLFLFALMLWLHNLGALFGAAVGIAFLILVFRNDWRPPEWSRFLLGHLAVLVAWIPALLILRDQAPTWIDKTWLTFVPVTLQTKLALLWAADPTSSLTLTLLIWLTSGLALITLAFLFLRRVKGLRVAAALMVLAVLPAAISITVSATIAPIFITRTMSAVAVPARLLLGLAPFVTRAIWRRLALACLVVLLVFMTLGNIRQREAGAREKWYDAVNWIADRASPGDMIYAYPNEAALPLGYAMRDLKRPVSMREIPSPVPTFDGGPGAWNPTGSRGVFSLPPARLATIADAPGSQAIRTIWLLRTGPWTYDEGDHFLKALRQDREIVGHWRLGAIEIHGLRRKAPAQ